MNDLCMKTEAGALTLPQIAELAGKVLSPAGKHLAFALIEALRGNRARSRRRLDKAESACTDEAELCYVLHVAAMVLTYLGETHVAMEKDRRSPDLCDRLGCTRLQADVLSALSSLYHALGHADLAAAYADEADKRA
jgi:hypothetical protein